MRDASLRGVHEMLLMKYVRLVMMPMQQQHDEGEHEARRPNTETGLTSDQQAYVSASWVREVRHMARSYLVTARVWQMVFSDLAGNVSATEREGQETEGKRQALAEVYEQWGRSAPMEATLAWAGWLLGTGKGKEASLAVVRARGMVSSSERTEMETRWTKLVCGWEAEGASL